MNQEKVANVDVLHQVEDLLAVEMEELERIFAELKAPL